MLKPLKTKFSSLKLVGLVVLGLAAPLLFSHSSQAAARGGVTISPAYQDIAVNGNESLSEEFSITNNDNTPATFDLTTVDMGALNDTGGIVFSGLPADYAVRYGLAKWLSLPEQTVTLAGHEARKIAFTISTDDSFTPGGHYGAIVAKLVTDIQPTKNQIRLNPELATILLVRKIGGEKYGLTVASYKFRPRLWLPIYSYHLNFGNTGNVHIVPRGLVTITNPFGHEVARGIINNQSGFTLPGLSRDYVIEMSYSSKLLWPGRYHIHVAYRYDGRDDTTNLETSFLLLNIPLVILVFGLTYVGVKTYRRYHKIARLKTVRAARNIIKYCRRSRLYEWLYRKYLSRFVASKYYQIINDKVFVLLKPKKTIRVISSRDLTIDKRHASNKPVSKKPKK